MELEEKYIAKDGKVIFRIIDNQAIVLFLTNDIEQQEQIRIFNEVATRIWELIDGRKRLSEIVSLLCQEYEVEYKQAVKEVVEFVNKLYRDHLINLKNKPEI